MQLTYTQHALRQMERREIRWSWVERVVASPSHRMRDPEDSTVERFYGPIEEHDGRVLRAAVNTSSDPWRVVTVFFGRAMRGES